MEQGGSSSGTRRSSSRLAPETLVDASEKEVNKLLERASAKRRGKQRDGAAATSSSPKRCIWNSQDATREVVDIPSACGAPAALPEENAAEVASDDNIEWEIGVDGDGKGSESWNGEVVIDLDGTPSSGKRSSRTVRRANAKDKEFAELVHKVHLLCLLARGRLVDSACDDTVLRASLLSLIPPRLASSAVPAKMNASQLQPLVKWLNSMFRIGDAANGELQARLSEVLAKQIGSEEEIAAISVAFFRALGFDTRLVSVLDATSIKPDAESLEASKGWSGADTGDYQAISQCMCSLHPPNGQLAPRKTREVATSNKTREVSNKTLEEPSSSQAVSTGKRLKRLLEAPGTPANAERSVAKSNVEKSSARTSNEQPSTRKRKCDDEFELELARALEATSSAVPKPPPSPPTKEVPPRLEKEATTKAAASTSHWSRTRGPLLHWAEVYCGDSASGRWVHVDAARNIVDDPGKVETAAGKRVVRYVLAFAGTGAKDVTRRYVSAWSKITALRVDQEWWNRCISPLKDLESNASSMENASRRERSAKEDMDLETKAFTEPLPTNQQAYRNHHLYAIERWLTRYQALHPKGPVLGSCGGWRVYPRSCVQDLHTKERWLREGFAVKDGEVPVKVLKSRPRKEKDNGDPQIHNEEENLVNLFGKWQTEPWQPPPAVNGIVPRNERGQVDVWSEKCIPPGTVHLRLPRLGPVAQMLKVDFAPAMVGFEIRQGRSVPVYQGIIVCEEFKDAILEVYMAEEQERQAALKRKEEEQACIRWRQLLRSISTRQRLRAAYEVVPANEVVKGATTRRETECAGAGGGGGDDEGHVHSFREEDEMYDEQSCVRTKRCACGFELRVEEM